MKHIVFITLTLVIAFYYVSCAGSNGNGNSNGNGKGNGNNNFTSHTTIDDDWKLWKSKHKKDYKNNKTEESLRRNKWENNFKKITQHNKDFSAGKKSFKMAINQFGDMDLDEFKNIYLTLKQPTVSRRRRSTIATTTTMSTKITTKISTTTTKPPTTTTTTTTPSSTSIPNFIDWRQKGYVTPIKDQGSCGSCWAFSAVAALEGANYKKSGKLVVLSEQQLVDCSGTYGNGGCNGGWMDSAFEYVIDNKGIDTAAYYPYKATEQNCKYSSSNIGGTATSIVNLPYNDEAALTKELATAGPISVAINAGLDSLQFYSSGIYYDSSCDDSINHGVTIVGYGTNSSLGMDYYIVKNSWGTWWGDKGYILMARNKKNHCGIASYPSYPVV